MEWDVPDIKILDKKARLEAISKELQDPITMQDQKHFAELNIEYSKLSEITSTWDELQKLLSRYAQAVELTADPDLAELAEADITNLGQSIPQLLDKLNLFTLPELPNDNNSAIVEVRAGTGGVEASLFAEELYRMYIRFLSRKGWPTEQLDINYHDEGGIKEVSFEVNAPGSFGELRFESGVHRVQRVPVTESGGRIHTSAASVVVLPQVELREVEINDSDLRIEVFRSSGPGGQSVNTTDSAVRITHTPTGITVSCQDGKSQHKNKDKAMSILASKLYAIQLEEASQSSQALRSSAIQSGDRSAKVRTYNFPQGRVTDHRVKETWHNLAEIMEGEIEDLVSTVNKDLRLALSNNASE